jgi:hypothetical protein
MSNVRPVLKLKSKSYLQLADYSERVCHAMTENEWLFLKPPVAIIDQMAANALFRKCILEWGIPGNLGSHASNVRLRAARKLVEKNLRVLTAFVHSIAQGDEMIILLAGMRANIRPARIGMLAAPENLRSHYHRATKRGQYRLRWSPVKGVRTYHVYMSDRPDGSKTLAAVVTKTLAIIELPEISLPTLRYFWVSAVGAAGESPLSNVCEAVAWPVV